MSLQRPFVELDEQKADALFAELDRSAGPGICVGVALAGRPIYRKGFGLVSRDLPLVLTPTVRMRVGSVTKQFTALAYMLLCEEGQSQLDDPLGKYLPDLHPATASVTARQIMGNISGIRDAADLKMQFSGIGGRWVSSDDFLSFYSDLPDANAPPGVTWIYNNGAWILLSLAVERLSGQSLEEFFRTRIFEPLGMHDTLVSRDDHHFVPNSATSHMLDAAGVLVRGYYGHDFAGAGAIVSTVDDMLRWLAHMDAPRIGSAATWAAMKSPQPLTNGLFIHYGLGLILDRYRGVDTIGHTGGWTGASAHVLKVPAANLDLVVLLNRDDLAASTFTYRLLDLCVRDLEPLRTCSGPFATGLFQSPATGRVIQLSAAREKWLALIDGVQIPLARADDRVVRPEGPMAHLKWELHLQGDWASPRSILFSDYGTQDELCPVQPDDAADIGLIQGRYRSDGCDTDVTIEQTPTGPRLRAVGRFGAAPEFTLRSLAAGIWQAKTTGPRAFGGILSFDSPGYTFSLFDISHPLPGVSALPLS